VAAVQPATVAMGARMDELLQVDVGERWIVRAPVQPECSARRAPDFR
jgi:hypothetical protein